MSPEVITELIIFAISFIIILFAVMYYCYQEDGYFDTSPIAFFGFFLNFVVSLVIASAKLYVIPFLILIAFVWILVKLFKYIIIKLDMMGGKKDGW